MERWDLRMSAASMTENFGGIPTMVRPRLEHPTPAELEVLKILWEDAPLTVREVMNRLNQTRPRAYTSVLSLMNVMADKELLVRTPRGRAFVYEPGVEQETTLGEMASQLVGRAFEGSASALVAHLLAHCDPSAEELDAIRDAIDQYQREQAEQ